MLTPFDIRDKIQRIERNTGTGTFAKKLRTVEMSALRLEVLKEIARGSPDAKSLAIAVLEIEA